MAVNLQNKYKEMREEGAHIIEYERGYLAHCRERCKLVYAERTAILNNGTIKHEQPCVSVSVMCIPAERAETGTKEEILKAIEEGRIAGEHTEILKDAVQNARFLYLHEAKKIFIIDKSEPGPEQPLDAYEYYRSTEREEAIARVIEHLRQSNNRLLGRHNIQEKDMLAIAAFISLQLP